VTETNAPLRRVSRALLALVLPVAAMSSIACSGSNEEELPQCPASKVVIDQGWVRTPVKYGAESLLLPERAVAADIPPDGGSRGERWTGGAWNVYYKRDSIRTNHEVERGSNVHDYLACVDTTTGIEGTVITLTSTSNAMPGRFGQATWKLPEGGNWYIAVLAPGGTTQDSMLSVIRSVRFKAESKAKAKAE
jgi:hypothetical protein